MAMGANYSFELVPLDTYAPQFMGQNHFFLGSVDNSLFTKFYFRTINKRSSLAIVSIKMFYFREIIFYNEFKLIFDNVILSI